MSERQKFDPHILSLTDFRDLRWEEGSEKDALETVVERITNQGHMLIDWYSGKARRVRFWARALRFAAIVFSVVAASIPILSEAMKDVSSEPVISVSWAYLALVIGGGAISTDRFFGYSTAWIRFIDAQIALSRALTELHWDLEVQRASWSQASPTAQELDAALSRVERYLSVLHEILEDDFRAWQREFKGSLKELDELVARKHIRSVRNE